MVRARATTSPRLPATAEDLARAMADESRYGELFPESPDGWDAFGRAFAATSPHVREMEALAKQQALQDLAAVTGVPEARIPVGDVRRPKGKARWKRPAGTLLDPLVDDLGDRPFAEFLNVINPQHVGERDLALRAKMQDLASQAQRPQNLTTMSERIPSQGGFLVPEVLRDLILAAALEESIVRPLARTIVMDSLRVPLPIIDDISHVDNVYGGVAGYWTAEGAALSATAPGWGRLELEARKLTAYTTIPNELLQDSITPLDEWFNMFFPRALAWFEDFAFINGTGDGEPQGYLNSPAAVKVSTSTDHVIAFPDLVNTYARIYPPCLTSPSLRWIMSPDARAQLLQMTYSASTAVSPPPWLPAMQVFDEPTMKIFGIPVCMSEKVPSSLSGNTTQAGAIGLCDFSFYLLGDRQAMQVAVSEEYLFGNDLVAYRVVERLDGRIWQQSPISPANGSDQTLSSVVLMDTTS
jgi:HK97 family phage major capsid protein